MYSKYGFFTTDGRSRLMARIKSGNTTPELILRKALWAKGLRYRINVKSLPGKPDIVFSKYKLAIFIDGEFWHGYNWVEKRERIRDNREYWIKKIERNIERDMENNKSLSERGFSIIRFWEKDIKKDLDGCLSKVFWSIENQNPLT